MACTSIKNRIGLITGASVTKPIADLVVYLLTHRNSAVMDDAHLRRATGDPRF